MKEGEEEEGKKKSKKISPRGTSRRESRPNANKSSAYRISVQLRAGEGSWVGPVGKEGGRSARGYSIYLLQQDLAGAGLGSLGHKEKKEMKRFSLKDHRHATRTFAAFHAALILALYSPGLTQCILSRYLYTRTPGPPVHIYTHLSYSFQDLGHNIIPSHQAPGSTVGPVKSGPTVSFRALVANHPPQPPLEQCLAFPRSA